ncbi:MAG: tetratricopeptide repeat protein [Sphingomonadales bacterium]
MSRIASAFAFAFILVLAAPAAFAAPSGGGSSGGSMPSGPDPNKAYADGVAALQAGDYKKAERHFKTVINAVPKNPEANYYMGMAKAGNGKHDDAIKYLEKSVKYDEYQYGAWDQLGRSYMALGKKVEAQQALDALNAKAQACGETCPPALTAARDGLKSVVEGASPAAAPAPQSMLFGPPTERRAAYLDAVALINTGRFEEAIAGLRTLGAAIGPNADVLNYLGYASRKLGRFEQALEYYEQALALDPDHRGAHEYLGELFVELRRMDEARAQLAALDRLCPYGCTEREMLAERIDAVVVGAR